MKKFLAPTLLIIFSLLFIIGIVVIYIKHKDDVVISEIDGVSLEIKEGTLTNTRATIIITDTNDEKYMFGLDFKLQKLEDGKWKYLKVKNTKVGVPLVGLYVKEDNKLEMVQNWELAYGSLPNGKYRLIKETFIKSLGPIKESDKLNFAVEFSI